MTNEPLTAVENGAGAAAVLAVAVGSFTLGVLALASDASPAFAKLLNVWNPTGPLAGVTLLAIAVWLVAWLILTRIWAGRTLDMKMIGGVSAALIVGGLLLTFPPFMDLLQGK
jgi:hypothetical protein